MRIVTSNVLILDCACSELKLGGLVNVLNVYYCASAANWLNGDVLLYILIDVIAEYFTLAQ